MKEIFLTLVSKAIKLLVPTGFVNKVIEIRNKLNNNTRNEVDKMKIRKR